MADDSSASVQPRATSSIVGGGCYGTFYAGQLLRAAERGGPASAGCWWWIATRTAGSAAEIGAGRRTASS